MKTEMVSYCFNYVCEKKYGGFMFYRKEVIFMNNELYHHGVKGMKWGVRRYQNAGANKRRSKKVSTDSEKTKERKKIAIFKKAFNEKIKDIDNSTLNHGRAFITQHLLDQQFNDWSMQETTRASINAANQAASLGISGGANPFMFGMM